MDLYLKSKSRDILVDALIAAGFKQSDIGKLIGNGEVCEIGYIPKQIGIGDDGSPILNVDTSNWCINVRTKDAQLAEKLSAFCVTPQTPYVVWAGGLNG